jgi:signal transduction histidine kinase
MPQLRRPARLPWEAALLGLLAGLVSLLAPAQDTIPFRHFTPHDGLPHESITALAQTADGRLWVGTPTGLSVYDGRRFNPVHFPDSLRNAGVLSVQPLPDGSAWVALRGWHGAVQVRRRRVVRVERLPTGAKMKHLIARADTLLAATEQAVWSLPPEARSFRRRPLPYDVKPPSMLAAHPGSGAGIRGAARTPGGPLWLLDGRFGPGRLRPDGSVAFVGLSTRADSLWTSLAMAPDGRLLLTRRGGHALRAYDPGTRRTEVLLEGLRGANYVFRAGDTAYVTSAGGLQRVDLRTNRRRAPLGPSLGLPDAPPTRVLRDRDRTLWVGTRNGLLHLHAPSVRHVTAVGGEALTYANRFKTGRAGALWVQTYGSGLVRLRPSRRRATPDGRAEWGQGVRSADGRLHALSNGTWYRHRPDAGWQPVGPTGGAVRGTVGPSGIAYFWHDDGVYRHDPEAPAAPRALLRWPPDDRAAYQLARSPDGRLLVRARDALLEIHPEAAGPVQVDTVAHLPLLADVGGRYMTASAHGDVWIVSPNGGQRGLLHVNIDADAPRPHLHLRGESVYNVSVSGDSLVLASARSGLFLLDAPTGSLRRHLTHNDGLLSTHARGAAVHGDSLYVSHSGGITVLPLALALRTPSPPAATITGVRVSHAARPVRDSLSLPAADRTLDVHYAAPHLRNPQRVTFEYRLLPDDTTWRVTDQPARQFAALGPGSHRFEVRARIGDRTGPPASLSVTIAPHVYETGWFWGLCLVGLIGVGGLAYRWRVARLRRREAALEQAVAERTRELRDEKKKTEEQAERLAALDAAKNRFFANLSHEFRTPLTLIIEPLRALLRSPDDESLSLSDRLRPVLRNARRLERLIGQLLDLSKLSAGQMDLQRRPVDLVARARELHEAFAPLAERHDLSLAFRTETKTLPAAVDPDKLDKILSNLLSNAIKFTGTGGTVWLAVSRSEAPAPCAHLVVKDTGVGMPEADLQRIFDRFEQVDGSTTRPQEGTGIGLALTRDLVELHGGTIGVESEPGVGSAFTVRLPIGDVPSDALADAGPDANPPPARRRAHPARRRRQRRRAGLPAARAGRSL